MSPGSHEPQTAPAAPPPAQVPSQQVRRRSARTEPSRSGAARALKVALLTGGGDKPYALGIAEALTAQGVALDFIGSDDLRVPEVMGNPLVQFFNLRGDQRSDVHPVTKMLRVLAYYTRLIRYAFTAKPKVFHILWNNKFPLFDRTFLLLYYRLLGKRLVFTAHNVNAGKRDGNDSWLNRLTLAIQYRLVDHVFVHTEKMKRELMTDFAAPESKATVIPFGINNTVPNTELTPPQARERLGVDAGKKTLLFFGNIAPYKGLEHLVSAFIDLSRKSPDYHLVIAGLPRKDSLQYWDDLERLIQSNGLDSRVLRKIHYVPDEETEVFFKAADVLLLPYTQIFQSGVLFLGYSFGLPVIAADVGSLKEEIVEGETGLVFRAADSKDLARTIEKFFRSDLYLDLEERRQRIRDYANARYSWTKVASLTRAVYSRLLGN